MSSSLYKTKQKQKQKKIFRAERTETAVRRQILPDLNISTFSFSFSWLCLIIVIVVKMNVDVGLQSSLNLMGNI